MEKITAEKLVALKLCDAKVKAEQKDGILRVQLDGADCKCISFNNAKITELRILGYEVLNEDEEAVFEMPDVEILGEKISEALDSLNESNPFAVEFRMQDEYAVLVLCDDTDTYEIYIDYSDIEAE